MLKNRVIPYHIIVMEENANQCREDVATIQMLQIKDTKRAAKSAGLIGAAAISHYRKHLEKLSQKKEASV
jgi:hypothetical protein